NGSRVNWPGATEGDEVKIGWVITAFNGEEAQELVRLRSSDIYDAAGRLAYTDSQRLRDGFLYGPGGRLPVERQFAVQQMCRQMACYRPRVCQCRLHSSAPVADGPRIGAGTFRPHFDSLA